MEIQWARRRGALLGLPPAGVLWSITAILVALYAAHQGFGLGGRSVNGLFDDWINDGLLWCAAVACAGGALKARRSRAAWLLVSLALAVWAIGDTIWSIRFGDAATGPATSELLAIAIARASSARTRDDCLVSRAFSLRESAWATLNRGCSPGSRRGSVPVSSSGA